MNPHADSLHVGIDVGSVSLNCIALNRNRDIVYEPPYERHLGKVRPKVLALLQDLYARFGKENIRSVSFTGSHGKNLSELFNAPYEFETISQVLGAIYVLPGVRTIISMGGQDTALLQINHYPSDGSDHNCGWELEYFNTNGPCASGTGSFIDQQAQRLATSLYTVNTQSSQNQIDQILTEFITLGLKSRNPANVACRCTVFTKSDMIHLQNKGEKLEDIIYGLNIGNVRNYMSTIVSHRVLKDPIIFIGGLSLNQLQVKAFRDYFPDLWVPPHNTAIGALGVALQAVENNEPNQIDISLLAREESLSDLSLPVAPRLELKKSHFQPSNEIKKRPLHDKVVYFLGIDIGSTTTKYALINRDRHIIDKYYVPTQGKPVETTQRLLRKLRDHMGKDIHIVGVATTGSGRNVVGDFLNADLIIDEITAHAKGAVQIDPEVDTIFEIGGQDSKYISLANTYPLDFDMNKVCAAGTGSFLHELANKYGINIVEEFQDIALSSKTPIKLAERCTVFMESDLVSYHQKGVALTDLMAGLCYAIVYNYLNRVVEKRKIGQNVMFLGGPSLNKGVVAAFENVLGRAVLVPAHREVLGAYGAAVSIQEKMMMPHHLAEVYHSHDTSVSIQERKQLGNLTGTTFRGLDNAINDQMSYEEKICRADPNCHNQCKLKIYDFDGRKSIWGGECGRYEVTKINGEKKENYFALRRTLWQTHIADVVQELKESPLWEVDDRPTVGMQSSLYGQSTAVLWAHFFDQLGLRLVLTPPTNPRLSRQGIEAVVAETCYPVKVSHGHVKELIQKTRLLFLPSIVDMPSSQSGESGFFCPMVQSNSYMVRNALDMRSSALLTPTVHLNQDPETLALELADQLQTPLGVSKKRIKNALFDALAKQEAFTEELYKKGREIMGNHDPNEPMVIVTGRPYNLYDERLNLRLGNNLAKIGMTGLPMDFVDVRSVDLSDFPSMYWGYGAQILRTTKFIHARPYYFGLHLTNFSCGADSFLEHFYRYIMGEDPYLILELDEHSAVAGVMTRIEAFKNVLENFMQKQRERGVTSKPTWDVAN